MQFSKNTSITQKQSKLSLIIKVALVVITISIIIIILGKIDFPSPNEKIEKIIPNEKLKIVK
tara:strand:- start:1447 stop:1632 length:186 start_codon:yes stop_codon:yes gene_type:complete